MANNPPTFQFPFAAFLPFLFCHIVILISIFSALLIADTKIDLILADFSEKIVTFGKLSLTNTTNSKHYTIDTNQYLLKLVQHLITFVNICYILANILWRKDRHFCEISRLERWKSWNPKWTILETCTNLVSCIFREFLWF